MIIQLSPTITSSEKETILAKTKSLGYKTTEVSYTKGRLLRQHWEERIRYPTPGIHAGHSGYSPSFG